LSDLELTLNPRMRTTCVTRQPVVRLDYELHGAEYSSSQEIPHLSWNPKVHYRVHNTPLPRPCGTFHKKFLFTVRSCWLFVQPPDWRTTPCRFSATAY